MFPGPLFESFTYMKPNFSVIAKRVSGKDLSVMEILPGETWGKLVCLILFRCWLCWFPLTCKKSRNPPFYAKRLCAKCPNWYMRENQRKRVLRPQSFRGSQQGYITIAVWRIFSKPTHHDPWQKINLWRVQFRKGGHKYKKLWRKTKCKGNPWFMCIEKPCWIP